MAHENRPLDDMPDTTIAKRAEARRGDVLDHAPEFGLPDDGPSDDDIDRFSGVTQNCWRCGTELYDDATVCWNCQASVGPGGARGGRPPIWAIVVGVGVALVLSWLVIF